MAYTLPEFKLERFFAKYEFTTKYLLSSSDCETLSIEDLLSLDPKTKEDNINKILAQRLGYTESSGDPELKKLIAQLYQDGPENITADNILVGSGAEELIYIFFRANFKQGDHVIIHYPCYQSLYQVAKSLGCEISLWKSTFDQDWELDTQFLEQNLRSNTKAIIFNTPHNPTGYLMNKTTWQIVLDFASKNNLLVFCDEVYRYLEYDTADTLPTAASHYSNAISLGVMSKSFGLAGLRIGWIVTKNQRVYDNMAAYKDYTSICNSGPSELLSIIALKQYSALVARNKQIIKENIAILNQFFSKWHKLFDWKVPKAGAISFVRLKHATMSSTEFCEQVVKESQVLLLPSDCYEYDGNSIDKGFRVGFARKNMHESVTQLDLYLEKHFSEFK
jgi:aspartate/methionine/tyrosine aminotransferase